MPDLDFPTSPSVNDTYSFGGKTWVWTGSYWRLQQTGAINNIPIGNVVPAAGTFTTLSATGNIYGNGYNIDGVSKNQTFSQNSVPTGAIQGDVWINTDTGRQYIYFSDGTSSQWAEMEPFQAYSSTVTIANVSQQIDSFTGDGSTVTFTLTNTPTSANVVTVNYNGATLLHSSYSVSGANITFGSAPANGYEFDVTTIVGGDSQSVPAAGSNTQIQFNNTGVFGGTANLTFSTATNTLATVTISATGNITGDYILGNGSQLTGLPATYSNANVSTYLASGNNTSNIVTTGNISGSFLLGNGSQLTGVASKAYATGMSLVFGG